VPFAEVVRAKIVLLAAGPSLEVDLL